MPSTSITIPAGVSVRFRVGAAVGNLKVPAPDEIATSTTDDTIAVISRFDLADPGHPRAAEFRIDARDPGGAQIRVGAGPGQLVIDVVVVAPTPDPITYHMVGLFEFIG